MKASLDVQMISHVIILLWLGMFVVLVDASENSQGTCQLYNSTECAEFFTGQYVWITKKNPLHRQEKKLGRWFRDNKRSGQISRECWQHAKALTCRLFYPKCDRTRNVPEILPLCKQDCDYVQGICRGEYKRTLHSKYFQNYFPLCGRDFSIFSTSYCSHLQTYNPSQGPVIFAEPQKHTRKALGEKAVLKCTFGIRNFLWDRKNMGMIREGTWLRDEKRVTDNRRISIRTRAKSRARLYMLMKIENFSSKDQGIYQCEITFANQTIRSSARLSVKPTRVIPIVVEKKTQPPIEGMPTVNGKCVPYSGDVCIAHLGTTDIFEQYVQPMNLLNKQLENFIVMLKNAKILSRKCEQFGQAVLCYNKFPRCHSNGKRYSPSICKRDCELFTTEYCKKELAILKNNPSAAGFMFIPQCNELPENSRECIPIKQSNLPSAPPVVSAKNEIHDQIDESVNCYDENADSNYIGTLSITYYGKFCDKWNQYLGYEKIEHVYCRNFGDSRPWCYTNGKKEYCELKRCQNVVRTPGCYVGRGEEYRGKISVSKSGRKCLQWNLVTHRYSNVDHSYCRNFLGDMDGPWCYVEQSVREMCNVSKCNIFRSGRDSDNKQSGSLIVLVVPCIIGSTVGLFVVILLAFYWKNKKLLHHHQNPTHHRHHIQSKEAVASTNSDKSTTDTDITKTNTLSSTASYDVKRDLPLPPPPPQEFTFITPSTPPFEMRQQKRHKKSVPEVKEACLSNLIKIGDGKLGQLWQGFFQQSRDKIIPVLVRKLKTDTRSSVISDFRQEMNSLRCLKHTNIELIVCISLMSEVPFMAFDGRNKTDLKEHIFGNDDVTTVMLLNYIIQILSGLEYLHQQKVLHKDLAARNCFITPEGVVYISKSGLGMYRYPNDYVNISDMGLTPVRWLSPETLKTGVYRIPTDVYMLGVLIWELFSYGERPFNEYTDNDAVQEILNENKLICPGTCPAQIWNFVEQCWIVPGCQRPSVAWIRRNIRALATDKISSSSV